MQKRNQRLYSILGLLLILAMVMTACMPAAPAGDSGAADMGDDAAADDAGDAGEMSWWAEAAQPYAGVTIRGVSESTPPSNYVADVLAAQFEAETGITVEFETTSWDSMYDKAIKDMEANTGIYDFVYIEQDIIASRDGVLLVLHDIYLESTTDVASKFPKRARGDGSFYAIDFTLEGRAVCVSCAVTSTWSTEADRSSS